MESTRRTPRSPPPERVLEAIAERDRPRLVLAVAAVLGELLDRDRRLDLAAGDRFAVPRLQAHFHRAPLEAQADPRLALGERGNAERPADEPERRRLTCEEKLPAHERSLFEPPVRDQLEQPLQHGRLQGLLVLSAPRMRLVQLAREVDRFDGDGRARPGDLDRHAFFVQLHGQPLLMGTDAHRGGRVLQ